jgi:hypothetical protein
MIKKADRIRFEVLRSKLMRVASEIGPKIQDYDIDQLKLPGGIYNREAASALSGGGAGWRAMVKIDQHCFPEVMSFAQS